MWPRHKGTGSLGLEARDVFRESSFLHFPCGGDMVLILFVSIAVHSPETST